MWTIENIATLLMLALFGLICLRIMSTRREVVNAVVADEARRAEQRRIAREARLREASDVEHAMPVSDVVAVGEPGGSVL